MSQKQRIKAIQKRKGTPPGSVTGSSSFYAPLDPSFTWDTHETVPALPEFVKGFLSATNSIGSADEILQNKINNKVLMLDNSQQTTKHNNDAPPSKKRKRMSGREAKRRGLYDLPPEECKYEKLFVLHTLWTAYIDDLMGDKFMAGKLLKADLHGAIIKVTKTKTPPYLGLSGLVIHETTQTFKVVTHDDRLVILPKKGSVFTLVYGENVVTLYGNHIIMSSAERSKRKFKVKHSLDL